VHGDDAPTPGWNFHHHLWAPPSRTLWFGWFGVRTKNRAGGKGCGKAARWKSQKADFPPALGNPAKNAGFPLSHSPDYCWFNLKPDRSCAKKTGHFNLLTTEQLYFLSSFYFLRRRTGVSPKRLSTRNLRSGSG
jgi:hypothetical protein